MSVMERIRNRDVIAAGILGLVLGCLVGWLVIGWGIWPVQYVGEAYTYELSSGNKEQYVASLADSYSLRRQIDTVSQRLAGWSTGDKVTALAELYAGYEQQGAGTEARQIVLLATNLQQVEKWEAGDVNAALNGLVTRYLDQGDREHAQFISLFGNEIGLVAVVPGEEGAPLPAAATPAATTNPPAISTAALLPVLVLILLALVFVLVVLYLLRRRENSAAATAAMRGAHAAETQEYAEESAAPLLAISSTYRLGMDSFDESFSIEADGTFKGECGMGISEVVGEDTPRKVMAFEVWLYDKSDIRTITKVLLSEHAFNNEALRTKLSARGEAILAQAGTTVLLETAAIALEATVAEMEYGAGEPPNGFFNTLTVSLTASAKPSAAPLEVES